MFEAKADGRCYGIWGKYREGHEELQERLDAFAHRSLRADTEERES